MNNAGVPSLFDALTPIRNTDEPLISDGDCGIVLRVDGRVEAFSTNTGNIEGDPSKWQEYELNQIAMGRKLMAISVALQSERLMSILMDVTEGLLEPEQARHAFTH